MNDLDDDLLKELGLEPKEDVKPQPAPPKAPAAPKPQPKPAPVSAPKQAVAKPAPQKMAPSPQSKEDISGEPKKVATPDGLAQATQVQVVAVVGKKTATLKDLMELNEGSLLELGKLPNDLIDLVANGKLVAKGQLVLIDGRVGVQIKQVYR